MQGRHTFLQRGMPAATDRDRRGAGEEVQASPRQGRPGADSEPEPAEDPSLGSVSASI
jgi:hypothetical protein